MNIQIEDQPTETALAPRPRWYVAETELAQERTALHRLAEKRFEAYLPMRRAASQATRVTAVPYFPRYLFVRLAVGSPGWTAVFSTIGVRSLLGAAHPVPVADSLITEIRDREADGFVPVIRKKSNPRFRAGQRLKIEAGPLSGYDAIFEEPIDERRVWILLRFLGRDSRAVADVNTLRTVS